ncbi:hypothetical protein [Nereida sp.]|uniref:hypothetical protein n=1 Tax=Nereida sp. TaxID=2736090 RepID=UPI003F69A3BA
MHRTFSPSTDWQTPTSITPSHIDRMERDLRTLRRDLFDHPREMTGPVTVKLVQTEIALQELRLEVTKLGHAN